MPVSMSPTTTFGDPVDTSHAAGALIFTASTPPNAVIEMAKDLNPKLRVLARANYLRDIAALREAGVNEVVSAEGEVALAMVERLLTALGATGEQLDRARDRVRREVLAAFVA